jgi:hypothetical protein
MGRTREAHSLTFAGARVELAAGTGVAETAHLAGQIEELNGWRKDSTVALPIRKWASDAIDYLEQRRAIAKEREAEERL